MASVCISEDDSRVRRQAEADSGSVTMPLGMRAASHRPEASDIRAISPMVQRQPRVPPTQAPTGVPSTEATDQPRNTKVMARPRCRSGTSAPMQAAACGVKTAAAIRASTRDHSNWSKLPATVARPWKKAYQSMLPTSRRRRSQRETTAANSGAPMHTAAAP